jgi:hypothetical protein
VLTAGCAPAAACVFRRPRGARCPPHTRLRQPAAQRAGLHVCGGRRCGATGSRTHACVLTRRTHAAHTPLHREERGCGAVLRAGRLARVLRAVRDAQGQTRRRRADGTHGVTRRARAAPKHHQHLRQYTLLRLADADRAALMGTALPMIRNSRSLTREAYGSADGAGLMGTGGWALWQAQRRCTGPGAGPCVRLGVDGMAGAVRRLRLRQR